MEPTNPQTPPEPQQAPTQPLQAAEPQHQTVAAEQPTLQSPQNPTYGIPTPPMPEHKSHTKRILLIVGIVLGVILLAFGALVVLALPSIQTAGAAKSFMTNVTAGRSAEAVAQAGGGDNTSFIESSVGKLKGSHASLEEQKYDSSGESFYLFNITGSDSYKSARVGISKENKKRVVTSFVYDSQKLKLVASSPAPVSSSSDTTATTTESKSTTSSTQNTPTTGACLTGTDFSAINQYPVDKGYDGKYRWSDSEFFVADGTTYTYPGVADEKFAKYKEFYNQKQAKDFTITLSGEVYSTSPDTALANKRAEKIKTDLTSKAGIPASRIVIGAPTNTQNSDAAASRTVDIVIESSDSCKS